MMTYGGYAHREISVNGALTIHGLASLEICVVIG